MGPCGIHRNEEADAFTRAGSSSAFVGPESYLALALSSVMELGDCLSSVENVAEKAQSRLDETLSIKQASSQNGSYR
jgi:hypothetical protein